MAIPLFPKRKDKDDGDLAGEDAKNSGLKEVLGLLGIDTAGAFPKYRTHSEI